MIWAIVVFAVLAFVVGSIFGAVVSGVALAIGKNETIDLLYMRLNASEAAAAEARLRARRAAGSAGQTGGGL
jgi:hypothetical protein